MTSAEREALVERAVEGGLLDEVLEEAENADPGAATPNDATDAVILRIRELIRELLGERPRQTKRLIRAAVRGVWRRRGLDWRDDMIPEGDWKKFLSALEAPR